MWKNPKIRIYSLILIILFSNNSLANEIKNLKSYYNLQIPERLN